LQKPFEETAAGLLLKIRLSPKSSKTGFGEVVEGEWTLYINQPPVEGQANRGAVQYIAKALGCPKSRIHLVSGEKSRHKRFLLEIWDDVALKKLDP